MIFHSMKRVFYSCLQANVCRLMVTLLVTFSVYRLRHFSKPLDLSLIAETSCLNRNLLTNTLQGGKKEILYSQVIHIANH